MILGALEVQRAFEYAYIVLCQAVAPINLGMNDCNRQSILGRIIRVTDEVIDYRTWVKDTFEPRLIAQDIIQRNSPPPNTHQLQYNQQLMNHQTGNQADAGQNNFRRSSISSTEISEESMSEGDENDQIENTSSKSRDRDNDISPTNVSLGSSKKYNAAAKMNNHYNVGANILLSNDTFPPLTQTTSAKSNN